MAAFTTRTDTEWTIAIGRGAEPNPTTALSMITKCSYIQGLND